MENATLIYELTQIMKQLDKLRDEGKSEYMRDTLKEVVATLAEVREIMNY